MSDYRFDYWEEALGQSLCEHGAWETTTPEQRILIAKDLQQAHEMWSEASGEINIPNPHHQEIKDLKEKYALRLKESEAREELWHRGMAAQMNVEPRKLYINHGDIEYSSRM